jgi:hypothetical protein
MKKKNWSARSLLRFLPLMVAVVSGSLTVIGDSPFFANRPPEATGRYWVWLRICFVVSAAIEWFRQWKNLRARDRRIGELESRFRAQPRIVPARDALRTELVNLFDRSTGTIAAEGLPCIRLRMVNDPRFPGDESEAEKVRAVVTFRRPDGTVLFTMDGRWADAPGRCERSSSGDTTSEPSVPFPVRQERSLDIAFKYRSEECCYGVNNNSWEKEDLRVPSQTLPTGIIVGQARFSGKFIDTVVNFQFRNEGAGNGLVALKYDYESKIDHVLNP